jgi:hypothetical protein
LASVEDGRWLSAIGSPRRALQQSRGFHQFNRSDLEELQILDAGVS